MCKGLGPDHDFGLAYPLCDDTDLIFAHMLFSFFVAV
jgi:hypothetical protein